MQTKEISVHIIAKPQIQHNEVGQWLTDMGVTYDYTKVASPGATLTELAGRRCYMAFQVGGNNENLTRIRQDSAAYIDNILSSGHGSVLEHANYTFAVEGLTRVATAELNRHRAGMAISEGSGRYIRPNQFGYWLPMSIREQGFDDYCNELGLTFDNAIEGQYNEAREQWSRVECAKEETREVFIRAFRQMQDNYDELEFIWAIDKLAAFKEKKKLTSMFRRILGMGISTGGVWTGNIRALRHIFEMRCSEAAEEEICHIATLMLEKMMESEPEIFGDFEKVAGHWQPKHRKV
jgi:thymidylate synthase (FAD)